MATASSAAGGGSGGDTGVLQPRMSRPNVLRQRVEACERSILELNKAIKATIKTARDLTKKNRSLVDLMQLVAANEYNPSLRQLFEATAGAIDDLETVRQNVITDRFEASIVPTLTAYSKQAFKPSKAMVADLERALVSHGKLVEKFQTLQVKNVSGTKLSAAEQALVDGTTKAENTDAKFLQLSHLMERKRVGDLKRVLTDYVSGRLYFHLRSVERLSELSTLVGSIDPETEAKLLDDLLEGALVGSLYSSAAAAPGPGGPRAAR